MSLPECAAQLGAALLAIKQIGAHADTVKIAAFVLGFGIALWLGVMFTSLFYEWHFQAGIAFQRQLDDGLLPPESSLAKHAGFKARIGRGLAWTVVICIAITLWAKAWSDEFERFATMKRRVRL